MLCTLLGAEDADAPGFLSLGWLLPESVKRIEKQQHQKLMQSKISTQWTIISSICVWSWKRMARTHGLKLQTTFLQSKGLFRGVHNIYGNFSRSEVAVYCRVKVWCQVKVLSPWRFCCSIWASGRSAHRQKSGLFNNVFVCPQLRHLTTVKRVFLFFPNGGKECEKQVSDFDMVCSPKTTRHQGFYMKQFEGVLVWTILTFLSGRCSYTRDEQWATLFA